jgi:hypothetical protein
LACSECLVNWELIEALNFHLEWHSVSPLELILNGDSSSSSEIHQLPNANLDL